MTTNNAVNTYIVPTAANEVTMPSQPAFLGVLGAPDLDVTGNGTTYRLGQGNALTEVFDQNADFNVNGTFTAPVTGIYFLCSNIEYEHAAGATSGIGWITTSNRSYYYRDGADTNLTSNGNLGVCTLADMDAADTATFSIIINGMGVDTVDITGAAPYTFCEGNLVV